MTNHRKKQNYRFRTWQLRYRCHLKDGVRQGCFLSLKKIHAWVQMQVPLCHFSSKPMVADLFLFCYETDFMMSLSDDKQADVIYALNTTSRYLDDILNINILF